MTSLSTRFFGQPRDTRPTVREAGRAPIVSSSWLTNVRLYQLGRRRATMAAGPRSDRGRLPRGQELHQHRGVHGLDQMGVEARLHRPSPVLLLAPTRERDQHDARAPLLRADPAAGLLAVH